MWKNFRSENADETKTNIIATSSEPPIVQSFSETITISNSKSLKEELVKKIKLLNEIYLGTSNIKIVPGKAFDLICKVDSTDSIDFNKIVKIVKTYWKTFYQSYKIDDVTLGKNNPPFKEEILKKFGKPGVYIQLHPSDFGIVSFETKLCNDVFHEIKAFISNKIDQNEIINVAAVLERELIEFAIKDKKFLQEKNLLNLQFDCSDKEIKVSGKRVTFEKINVQKILETFYRIEKVLMSVRSSFLFARQKLANLKTELKKKFMLLTFSQNLSENVSFEICGFKFDEDKINIETERIKEFLFNAKSVSISLSERKDLDLNKIKSQLKNFMSKHIKHNKEENHVYLNEENKIIIINGTNQEAIENLR